ncbi:MAG: hypothetical protein ABH871_02605 [Pseudomonadota bacterium]
MTASVDGNKGFTGLASVPDPNAPINSNDSDKNKRPVSSRMTGLTMLPIDPRLAGNIGAGLLPPNYGTPAVPQNPASAPAQQQAADKKDEKNNGGTTITAGKPKEAKEEAKKETNKEAKNELPAQPAKPKPTPAPVAQPAPQPEQPGPFSVGVEGVTAESIGLSSDQMGPVKGGYYYL